MGGFDDLVLRKRYDFHPPSQETPLLCGEECYCPPRFGGYRSSSQADDHNLALGEGGSYNGAHGFTRGAPFQIVQLVASA